MAGAALYGPAAPGVVGSSRLFQQPEQPFQVGVQHPAGHGAAVQGRREFGDTGRWFARLGYGGEYEEHGAIMMNTGRYGKSHGFYRFPPPAGEG